MPQKSTPKKKKLEKVPLIVAASKQTKMRFWVGFDLGGTKMLACVLDEEYRIIGSAKKTTNGSDGQIKGRKKMINAIHEAIANAGVDPAGLQGIAVGCPGLVNPEKGILLNAPNLGWKNMGIAAILNTAFHKPVAVLNDVDAGTFGEYKRGAGKGARSLLGVFPGTGVGTGFVYDGRLIMGRTVSAMELGMVYVPGTHLGSAEHGAVILEDLTSRLALASQAGIACYRGQLPDLDKKTRGNLRDLRSKALAGSFLAGDQASQILFRNSVRYLAMGVAAVVNLLAPDQITLGGGLVEEMPDLYLKSLKEEVGRFALPPLARGIKYSLANLGGNAVAVGGVAWLRERPESGVKFKV